ncbi:tyrosine-type recombinase/integrase [Pseudomonas caricapapayae]
MPWPTSAAARACRFSPNSEPPPPFGIAYEPAPLDTGIRDGRLWVQQSKTNAKRRIEITGELKVVIDRIMTRKEGHRIRTSRLIVMDNGQPMTSSMLRGRFDAAREAAGVEKGEFQMRDLRAKAGTDKAESSGDILQARDQLGHTTVVMTENYIRKRIGKRSLQPSKFCTAIVFTPLILKGCKAGN